MSTPLTPERLAAFCALLQASQISALIRNEVYCAANREQCTVTYHTGLRYTRVDVGSSGKYMVVNDTSEIFGIKGYGVIHRGHAYGTLDTLNDYDWSHYRAKQIRIRIPDRKILPDGAVVGKRVLSDNSEVFDVYVRANDRVICILECDREHRAENLAEILNNCCNITEVN